jgi:hypothetical protein
MIARRLAVLVALASPPELSAFSRIYGIWPGEDHLQDFWGPARLGFEGSFAYEASVLAASDDDVASIIGGIVGASVCRSWDDKPVGFSAGWHETRREPITPKRGSVVLVGEATEAPEATGSRPRNRRLSSATTSTTSVRAWE